MISEIRILPTIYLLSFIIYPIISNCPIFQIFYRGTNYQRDDINKKMLLELRMEGNWELTIRQLLRNEGGEIGVGGADQSCSDPNQAQETVRLPWACIKQVCTTMRPKKRHRRNAIKKSTVLARSNLWTNLKASGTTRERGLDATGCPPGAPAVPVDWHPATSSPHWRVSGSCDGE